MNKQSGRNNNNQQSNCCMAETSHFVGLNLFRVLTTTFFMLLAIMIFAGQARADAGLFSYAEVGKGAEQPVRSYRVAQSNGSMENWQRKSFSTMDMQKRLDSLSRDKKRQVVRKKKSRRAAKKRRAFTKPNLKKNKKSNIKARRNAAKRKTIRRKAAKRRTVRRKTRSAGRNTRKKTVQVATVVREPAKLQRCLQQAGYFNGVITGRMDDATLLSYLAFREDKNLQLRPNNLYDPVIQKALFSLCPDGNMSTLNQIIASAMIRKSTFPNEPEVSEPVKTAPIKTASVKTVPKKSAPVKTTPTKISRTTTITPAKVLEKTTHKKAVVKKVALQNKASPNKVPQNKVPKLKAMRKVASYDGPMITGSFQAAKRQFRMSGPIVAKGSPKGGTAEESFAKNVLAATGGNDKAVVKLAKMNGVGKREMAHPSATTSSFAMKRAPKAKTVLASKGDPMAPMVRQKATKMMRVASNVQGNSLLYSKSVSIADLAKVQPVNPNTCAPQTHEPAIAMSSSPIMSTGRPASSLKMAKAYDDGPMITGSISSSSSQKNKLQAPQGLARLMKTSASEKHCLPQDLYDLLAANGRKDEVSVCEADCQPAPKAFSQGQKALFARQYNINWCQSACLGIAQTMPLAQVMKIEREARVHVCMEPQVRLTSAVKKGLDASGVNEQIRALYARMPGGYGNENNIAVIIGNRNYGREYNVNDAGYVNAAAMKALLIEQLGYQEKNIITVKDARRSDLVGLFGKRGNSQGEVQKRLKANRDAQLMIYYSGHASSTGLGMDNYLLSVDAVKGVESETAYSLNVLYDNLREIDASSTQLFLETGFNANRSHMVLAPNIAERRVNVAPIIPVRGLAVFTATTGDQKPLIDSEIGIGLFTRYLISGLAGKADERPIGNSDRTIDSVELHVHLASKVRLAARKTLGLRQDTTLSRTDSLFLSQLTKKSR